MNKKNDGPICEAQIIRKNQIHSIEMLNQLKPGDILIKHYDHLNTSLRWVYVKHDEEKIYVASPSLSIIYNPETIEHTMFLTDCGILPYNFGFWNRYNWIEKDMT